MTHTLVPAPLSAQTEAQIAALAKRAQKAGGPLMKAVNLAGGRAEGLMEKLPQGVRDRIEDVTGSALEQCYKAASGVRGSGVLPDAGKHGHKIAVAVSGGAGGFGGLGSAVLELPATVSIFFAAIQKIAAEHGFDPDDEAVRLECLRVFGSGSPLEEDDGVNTGFLAARVMLNGAGAHAMIARIAPKFALVMGQKLAAQTVPVIGAVTGAAVNLAFLGYYQELAHVRFSLMKLAQSHAEGEVLHAFRAANAKPVRP